MSTLSSRSILLIAVVAMTACASGQGATRVPTPATAPTASVEVLYESGQDDDVVNQVNAAGAAAAPAEAWFAVQSELRLGRRAEALDRLSRLSDTASDAAVQTAARLELARLNNDATAIDAARDAAAAFGDNVFAQYEVGLSYLAQNDYAAAARAFDHCIDIAPTFAYAYYQAALAYDRLNRMDLMANRFDRFVRLAPNAPERPQVDTILRTVGGRP